MLGLDTTEIIFSIAIAIVYPFFFTKLTSKILNYENVNNMCDKYNGLIYPYYSSGFYSTAVPKQQISEEDKVKQIEADKCRKEKEIKLDDIKFKQHIMLIVVAFIGILATSAIQTGSTKVGVGIGGILTLMVALTMYWHKYNETAKLAVLGVSFVSLILLSVRLYKVKSLIDVFSLIEYGSK
jgi:hypothetical protein